MEARPGVFLLLLVTVLQAVVASSKWKCYHYTFANKFAMILVGEKSICEKHGRKYTKGINKNYPGCGTCWCCQAPKESGYIGCYQDDSTRILPKEVLKDKGMTVQKCQQFCGQNGFKFAGVEYGYECFCGNVLRKDRKRKESDCKMPCSGNKRQICGGAWRISIYTGKLSNCKEKCHKNGKCKRGRCRCKRGYTGDGINVCYKSCTCSASGDPHYRSFDGQVLHFMGTCKYTLSQYVNPSSACRFHVQVKNENRGNKRVSYTRSVHVVVRKTKIDLLKNRVVKVDGIKRYLPYQTGYFSIIISGRYVRLKTTCNVLITWDGKSAVTISVPSHFSQNLIGLCGNCNGIKDDFRTKDGLDVRTKPDKFTLIGESYLIREGNSEKCGVTTPPDPCTSALRNKANRNSACGQLNQANPSSPFKDCSQEDTALVQDIYDTCVYDYCAYSDQPDILNTIVCEAAEGLEERCENMGVDISWRTKQFCPFICEDNMEYSSAGSGCPATCVDLHAPKTCKLPPSEGCQCKKGFVLSDNKCIPIAQCGCRLPTGEYYPIDTEITSRDCRTVSRCVATKSGYAKMQVIRRQKCHSNAQCKLLHGVYDCACAEGFKGDGIKQCKGKSQPGTEKVICEGLKSRITCPWKKTIRILEATYGRTEMGKCRSSNVKTTSCSSDKPLPIIRKHCDGMKSCMVSANNGLYGDPCAYTYKYVTVRYVCEETGPKCGSSVCHPEATCHNGRCVCKKGFIGDGVNSCIETCTCVASGDPHYKSFDGQVIHFMGICTYTMVKSTSIDKCGGFEVQVQNEHRGSNTRVSYTQYVLVKLADATIRLDKNNVVFVNDVQVYTPYSCTNFEITTSGRYVRLQTKCNILITWNGVGTVAVSVPKTYAGIVTGLCGDCNGKKDDFRTATGEDVSLKKDKFELIGKSYTVPGIFETQDNKCVVVPIMEEPCSADQSSKAADDKYCGLLNPKNVKSPFMSCANKDMDMAKDLYESCLYDYCSIEGSPELAQSICESLEGYEEQCEDMGLSITWRKKDFCPLTCPDNMDYTTSGSGCPATCVDPDAPLTCRLPNTEGCQCKEGFLLSGNECVPKEQCGCRGPEGEYYPLGKQFTSSDCTIVTKCSSENGKPTLTVVKQQICHQNAKCRLRRGQYSCICKKKFKGNGVDVCTPECKQKCKINERCVKGKCRCENGLVRTKLGACKTPEDQEDVDECRKSTKGTEYKGLISLTQTGRTCQYWERQYPHKHVFSKLKTEHNYCRNPDNSGQPWCYTNDPSTRWEYCKIPMCAACSMREEIVQCKATVRVSGSCFYKSKVGSSCVYTAQLSDSQAIIKTSTQEMVLTNGGNLAECAIFTFNDGTLKIEDDVCKCF
ncbi:IgGFc-binding protein-like isoform X1 [Mytilus californianus]|uniref:IgGFc-binding protein-like isoform X1 n=1 Tax=Mytilus californianus TaxID=6549 RepID=UPI002247D191|nr:IgGFc-binding protein-like isoform X1 [Mytilus californianus]